MLEEENQHALTVAKNPLNCPGGLSSVEVTDFVVGGALAWFHQCLLETRGGAVERTPNLVEIQIHPFAEMRDGPRSSVKNMTV